MASTGVQTFTAANTTALADLGWIEDAGHYHVVSNKAVSQTAYWDRARYTTTPMDTANHYVQASGDTGCGSITARQVSATHTLYGWNYVENNVFRLQKVVNGAETDLDTYNAGTGTLVLKLIVNGAVQEGYISGTLRADGTDAVITTGTYCGISVWGAGYSLDDWSAADLAAGEGAIPLLFGGCLDTSMGGNTNVMTG